MKKIIYLFRHGETDWNKNKDIKYSEKVHNVFLNQNGREQAKKLTEILKDKNIEHIYTSKLKRANETAKILADIINIDLEIIDGLEEFSIYDNSIIGLTRQEIIDIKIGKDKWTKFKKEKDSFLDWRIFPNCETKREARERIFNTIIKICQETPYSVIGIASHGNVMLELLRKLDFVNQEKLTNCEIIKLKYDNNLSIIKRIRTTNN